MNHNWPRWIFASICKHFSTQCPTLKLQVEGMPLDTRMAKDFIELRVDGPDLTMQGKGFWRTYIEVNILIQSVDDNKDGHKLQKSIGIVSNTFTNIPVYRYGDTDDDDDSYLGCLQLISNDVNGQDIQVRNFGEVNAAVRVQQATVEGHYRMTLET